MHSQVNATLSMSLAQEEQEIQFASAGPSNPYQVGSMIGSSHTQVQTIWMPQPFALRWPTSEIGQALTFTRTRARTRTLT